MVAGLSCARGQLARIQEDVALPAEMADAEDRFAVTELEGEIPSVPAPSPSSKKVKKGRPAKSARTSGPFVYPNRRPLKDPFWHNEKHVFDITYFGVKGGEFTIDVLSDKVINGRPVYHVKGTAKSSDVFGMFYRIDDYIETFWDFQGLFSYRFHLVQDETKQTRDALELYDHEKAQTFFWNRSNHKERGLHESKEFKEMVPFSQDSFSALLYLRVLPMPDGAVLTFPVISEGKNWEAEVSVVRREEINTPMGRYKAIVLKPETKFNGIMQKRGDSFIWLSDDDRRYMLRLEAKLKIGTVIAECKRIEDGDLRK